MLHRSHAELYYHFVWSPHNRERKISIIWEKRLFDFLKKKSLELHSPILEINGIEDHIHILLRGYTIMSPSKIAHDLKGASSYMINNESFCKTHFGWQDGYGVFSVSPHNINMIARYIRNQKKHHASGDIRAEWEVTADDDDSDSPQAP
jgi:putative transposase